MVLVSMLIIMVGMVLTVKGVFMIMVSMILTVTGVFMMVTR